MDPDRWLPVLGGFFLLGALFEAPFVTTFSAAVAILIALTSWWRWHSLDHVYYRRKPFYRRAFPGETVALEIEVENRKILPMSWLRIEDPWPLPVGPEDPDLLAPSHIPGHGTLTNVFSLRWFERARRRYDLKFRSRGVYKVGPARMLSGDAFGVFDIAKRMETAEYLTVFPELAEIGHLDLPSEDPFGVRRSDRKIFEDPNQPMGIRDYRPEDGFRHIHWPATARTGEMQVKVYQPTSARVLVICLNVTTFARHWEGVYPALMEALVSTAAALVVQYFRDGYQVGLISNGCLAHSDRPFRIPPGRSPRQLGNLMEALAGVTPMVMVPFEEFLVKEMPKVYYGASLLVVTAVHPPALQDTLQSLRQHGRKVTMISLAKEPLPSTPGIEVLHLPFQEPLSQAGEAA
jgi:uncharacterized protein (DUF58 family)